MATQETPGQTEEAAEDANKLPDKNAVGVHDGRPEDGMPETTGAEGIRQNEQKGDSEMPGPQTQDQQQMQGMIPGEESAISPAQAGEAEAEEYEADFEDYNDTIIKQDAGHHMLQSRTRDQESGEEEVVGRTSVTKEVTWEEGQWRTLESLPPARKAHGYAGDGEEHRPRPAPDKMQKPKTSKSMRSHMRGTLTSFRQAAQKSDYDPNQTGILSMKVN